MQGRNIALAGLALAVVTATCWLWVAVRQPATAVSEERLAAARAEHARPRGAAPPPPAVQPPAGDSPSARREAPLPSDRGAAPAPVLRMAHDLVPTQEPALTQAVQAPAGDLDTRMDAANRLYDTRMYEEAQEAALAILNEHSTNVRMLRIVVSTACIMGDLDKARKYNEILPPLDQQQMRERCSKFGMDL